MDCIREIHQDLFTAGSTVWHSDVIIFFASLGPENVSWEVARRHKDLQLRPRRKELCRLRLDIQDLVVLFVGHRALQHGASCRLGGCLLSERSCVVGRCAHKVPQSLCPDGWHLVVTLHDLREPRHDIPVHLQLLQGHPGPRQWLRGHLWSDIHGLAERVSKGHDQMLEDQTQVEVLHVLGQRRLSRAASELAHEKVLWRRPFRLPGQAPHRQLDAGIQHLEKGLRARDCQKW
mmetsp:Transcript_27386/g.48888  ORF Transcript_27386/g.48888 Transcript_27386/m.48888 type:complete len:233 (+) Transcript_27386:207-905(+)